MRSSLLKLLLAVWFPFCLLASVSAQSSVGPTNATLPQNSSAPQLAVFVASLAAWFPVDISGPVGTDTSISTAQANQYSLTGPTIFTTPANVANLVNGDIAYISCDAGGIYASGNIDANTLVRLAIGKLGDMTLFSRSSAIILYSTIAPWCSYTGSTPSDLTVFTTTATNYSLALQSALQNQSITGSSSIMWRGANSTNSTSGGGTTYVVPTGNGTTVAMVVLYSITGLITLLFLIIIVTGAIRTHRYPEIYGARNVAGASRQSRARGMARAMLDTLPIIKFGSEEPAKTVHAPQDVELGSVATQSEVRPPLAVYHEGSAPATVEGADTVRIDIPDSIQTTSHAANPEQTAEADVTCSVCTEDFVRGEDARVLPCSHKFHPACIDPWLLNVSSTCPLCRVDLNPPTGTAPEPDTDDPVVYVQVQSRHRLLNLLSIGAMRLATPAERIEVLRELRAREMRMREYRNFLIEERSQRRSTIERIGRVLLPGRGGATTAEAAARTGGERPASGELGIAARAELPLPVVSAPGASPRHEDTADEIVRRL